MRDLSRSIARRLVEASGNARKEFERAMSEVHGADDAEEYQGKRAAPFSGVVVANKDRVTRWLEGQGYRPVDADIGGPTVAAYVHPERDVVVTVQRAFGAMVTAAFADVPGAGRRIPYRRRTNGHGGAGGAYFPGQEGPVH